jgi:transposase, IS30 family
MTKKYNQLTLDQRYVIEILSGVQVSLTQIAEYLGVHKSTISRELSRNVTKRGIGANIYSAEIAQNKASSRHQLKPKNTVFTAELKQEMLHGITEERLSPELVAAQWVKDSKCGVSHETIYKFIWHCKHTNKHCNAEFKGLHRHLRHGKRRRKRGNRKESRGVIPNRVSIEQRPDIVKARKRFGDIEADLIMGKAHQSALLVTIDRATLTTTINKLKNKNSDRIAHLIIKRLKNMPKIHTITFDNDQAFSQHEKVAKQLNAKTYFTRPYTSQDKGTIENRNGLIRMFFPKKTDFNQISTAEIKRVEKLINNRPVRKFNYLTPNEVFLKLKGSVALIS